LSIELMIVTPGGEVFRGPVESVVLPGSEGEFGVLAGHERFLAPLQVGEVQIKTETETLFGAIAEGFAEVNGREVAVLVQSCELASEIDVERAKRARERAEQQLAQIGEQEEGRARRYEAALKRALTRIAVSEKL
jgi:F-type H+-transporting ATPase subunit epsilon